MLGLPTVFYTFGCLVLSLYGLKVLAMTLGYWRVRNRHTEPPGWPAPSEPKPFVTVQLPIYNEPRVAGRAIEAACKLRWPRDRFEVQVLDDSDDGSREVVAEAARIWRARGVQLSVVQRPNRSGFKAGALAHGTARARGTVIAVFDADFLPRPDFLERTVPHLGPGVAAVQARGAHLNASDSLLTEAQALALDGVFVVEQTARARLSLFVNFNGTAGVWNRSAIEAAGGWQGDSLSEDIDLSFRAQLQGWRIVYLPEVTVPAELPLDYDGFRMQQRRWATGATQLLGKLGLRILRAPIHPVKRLHAVSSLAEHLVHPVTLAMLLASPLVVLYSPSFPSALGLVTTLSLAPPLMYAVAAASLHDDRPRRMRAYPVLAALAVGLSLNGTIAVARAMLGHGGPVRRTPKHGAAAAGPGREQRRAEHGLLDGRAPALGEVALASYAWLALLLALHMGTLNLAPLFAVFAYGYTVTAIISARTAKRLPPERRAAVGELKLGS